VVQRDGIPMTREQLDALWKAEGIENMPELQDVPHVFREFARAVFERGCMQASRVSSESGTLHATELRLGLAIEALRKLDESKAMNAWGHMIVTEALRKIGRSALPEAPTK
jgi:hypothetical protein